MSNKTNKTVDIASAPTVLQEKIAGYKETAREALRAELIAPRTSRIATFEACIDSVNKNKENVNHNIKVVTYEMGKLDTEHPNFEKTKESKENQIKNLEEDIKVLDKEIENLEKSILEQKEGIAKIETGETKVSKDALNALVSDMIKQNALNQA